MKSYIGSSDKVVLIMTGIGGCDEEPYELARTHGLG